VSAQHDLRSEGKAVFVNVWGTIRAERGTNVKINKIG